MRFAFTDDQLLFRDTIRDFLAKECPPERVRDARESPTGHLVDVWNGLAGMGVTGLQVPEADGGMGMHELDLVLLLEETGRVALPGPVIDTIAVAPALLAELPSAGTGAKWLAGIADGSLLVATAFGSRLVPYADLAALLLFPDGGDLVLVPMMDATIQRQASIDGSRRLFDVQWEKELEHRFSLGDEGRRLLAEAFDRGALAAAAQLLGLADRMLELTVDYAKERKQFGVPIGSFQAVKHHLADALLALSFARPVVYNAAYSVSHRLPTARRDVAMAKVFASDASQLVARKALQCHGAIGYTVEYDLHLYMKRAWALAASWGDATFHRDRVGVALGI